MELSEGDVDKTKAARLEHSSGLFQKSNHESPRCLSRRVWGSGEGAVETSGGRLSDPSIKDRVLESTPQTVYDLTDRRECHR